jgi:hypothetical protein
MKKGLRFLTPVMVSLVLLIPCFWQRRIQAGDLSSHLYNVWLAREIAAEGLGGLSLAPQATNVLADVILSAAVNRFGFETGHKVSMALLVLTLFWSAFAFVWTAAGRKTWAVAPCLAMLAYGWTFHMGFCNFFLSAGLSFLYLALASRGGIASLAGAVPVLALAATAHALPACWALSVHAYCYLAKKLAARKLPLLLGTGLLCIFAVRVFLDGRFPTLWVPQQLLFTTGADQAWLYGWKYAIVSAGLFYIWGILLLREFHRIGLSGMLLDIRLHVSALTAVAIAVIPHSIRFPQYNHALTYIAPRMSLLMAIALCSALASRKIPRRVVAVLSAFAVLFFSFVYADSRALNLVEDRMESLLGGLPPGARVISALGDTSVRIDALAHMGDRACIGRCYSYANYEPSTLQFRIRADAPSRVVLSNYDDCYAVAQGTYVVRESDGVLYQIRACGPDGSGLCLRLLKPGDITGKTLLQVLPHLW